MQLFENGAPFFKGNLHMHSTLSDGMRTPEEAMRTYYENGYDFIAFADHWHVGKADLYRDMLVLPGVEYNYYLPTQVLHIVALLPSAECANAIHRDMDYASALNIIRACGSIAIVAHPAWSLNTPDFLASLDADFAEVYNSVSNTPWGAARADATYILDVTAASYGKLFQFVASDDSHYYAGEQCQSYIMVQAREKSPAAIMDALRGGRFYASQGPAFHSVEMTDTCLRVRTSKVATCTFCSNLPWVPNRCHSGAETTEFVHMLAPGETFIRCEIADESGKRAWTSPIVVTQ